MEIEIDAPYVPIVLGKRKRYNSASPTIELSVKKLLLKKEELIEEYQTITQSTPYIEGEPPNETIIELQPKSKTNMNKRKFILDFNEIDFNIEYEKIKKIMDLFSKSKKEVSPPQPSIISLKDEKKIQALDLISEGGRSYVSIARQLKMRRQEVRNLDLKNKKFGGIFQTKKGSKSKLNEEHIEFLLKLVESPYQLGITLKEMKIKLQEKFGLIISVTTIYRALKKNKKVYKKIVWKKPKDNEPRTKNLRKIVAVDLLRIFMGNFSPVYIDESSFNLNIRPAFGWGTSGKVLFGKRPTKSANYSLLAAMDITGIIGWMVFRGGVKKEDFFYFLMELVKRNDYTRWKNENPIF